MLKSNAVKNFIILDWTMKTGEKVERDFGKGFIFDLRVPKHNPNKSSYFKTALQALEVNEMVDELDMDDYVLIEVCSASSDKAARRLLTSYGLSEYVVNDTTH